MYQKSKQKNNKITQIPFYFKDQINARYNKVRLHISFSNSISSL